MRDGYTALHIAAERGSAEWVRVLLEYGADVKVRTQQRQDTALHLATCQGSFEVFSEKLQLLLGRGADVNAQNADGDTTLHLAIARFGTVSAIETLLAAGASTELKGRKGHTPLLYAIYLAQEAKATMLLESHASPNSHDDRGRTPLHLSIASSRMSIEFIERIINAGADINQEDGEKHTPMYEAAHRDRRNAMRLLLDHGADCQLGNPVLERRVQQVQFWRGLGRGLPWPFG